MRWPIFLVMLVTSHRVDVTPVPPPAEVKPPVVAKVDFREDVLPVVQRCQPCHFPGGSMYTRLPFDRPETIEALGAKLFTRIKDESERATIRAFLDERSR